MRRPMKATRLLPCALLGGAMVVLLSCAEPAPLGVARHELAPPLPPGGSLVPSLLPWCAPLPYDSVTATIGPAGGVLAVGAHVLVFLPNSLDSAVTVTAVAPTDTVRRRRLEPPGVRLHQPLLLVLSYAACNLLRATPPPRLALTNPHFATILQLP